MAWLECKAVFAKNKKNLHIFKTKGKHLRLTLYKKYFTTHEKLFTICGMNKQDAINLLGGTPQKAAKAMGYKSVQAVYMWSNPLRPSVADRVHGAAARMKNQRKPRKASS